MKGKIKIVNGEVVCAMGQTWRGSQRGATTSSGSTSVGHVANSLSSNSFVNTVSRYNKGDSIPSGTGVAWNANCISNLNDGGPLQRL